MSKNRRLRKRVQKNRKQKCQTNQEDRHHIFYQRRAWGGKTKGKLRVHWYCTAYIPKNTLHHEIHENLKGVPVAKESSVRDVVFHLGLLSKCGAIQSDDPIEKKLRVLIALFDCVEPETTKALRKQLEIVERFNKPP